MEYPAEKHRRSVLYQELDKVVNVVLEDRVDSAAMRNLQVCRRLYRIIILPELRWRDNSTNKTSVKPKANKGRGTQIFVSGMYTVEAGWYSRTTRNVQCCTCRTGLGNTYIYIFGCSEK